MPEKTCTTCQSYQGKFDPLASELSFGCQVFIAARGEGYLKVKTEADFGCSAWRPWLDSNWDDKHLGLDDVPHVVVTSTDNSVHVVPVSFLRQVAYAEVPLSEIDLMMAGVLGKIILEWLDNRKKEAHDATL